MKYRIVSAKQKVKKLSEWHKKFILFPCKTSNTEMQFLTYVVRRLKPNNFDMAMLGHYEYEYKSLQDHITDKLMDK